MRRSVLIAGICCLVTCVGRADDDVGELRQRIAVLEKENRVLRDRLGMMAFAGQAANGVARQVKIDGNTVARLVVAREGWGHASPADVAAVCVSCTETILDVIRPAAGREPTMLVVRSDEGPMVLSQRGPNGEYLVLISSGDRHWAQIAYQFSHELGHVMCGDLTMKLPQLWFEESFCESLSLWTMDKMGETWKTKPPYDNWKSYASSLTSYIKEVRDRQSNPDSYAKWYATHRAHLTRQAYDRPKNRMLAIKLAQAAHANPSFYRAFRHLRRTKNNSPIDSMEWLLADWSQRCPADQKFAPKLVADLLGIEPKK